MTYQCTKEDKLQAFDNSIKLLILVCHNYAYTSSEDYYKEVKEVAESMRQMFWNELGHTDEMD